MTSFTTLIGNNLWGIIAFVAVLLLLVTFYAVKPGNKKLQPAKIKEFLKMLQDASDLDPELALVRIDAIIENILRAKGGRGTFGTMLKALPKSNVTNDLWKYHKMRNTLVHEVGAKKPTQQDIEMYAHLGKGLLR